MESLILLVFCVAVVSASDFFVVTCDVDGSRRLPYCLKCFLLQGLATAPCEGLGSQFRYNVSADVACCTSQLQVCESFDRYHGAGPLFCGMVSWRHDGHLLCLLCQSDEWLDYVTFVRSSDVCVKFCRDLGPVLHFTCLQMLHNRAVR